MTIIDTHTHLDGVEFDGDRDEVVTRAREAGIGSVFVPAIDLKSVQTVLDTCRRYAGFARPMIGLHPEEVRADYPEVLAEMKRMLHERNDSPVADSAGRFIAVGEVGLDFYWSREFEKEQLAAFEQQVQWSIETRLPLMIHCRKAQNELVHILRTYEKELPGGVFHCFTGNEKEAAELLSFPHFALGIGGVLTFKKSHLPEVLPTAVPLNRIVLETDSPYMAPVPMRGKRNESAFTVHILEKLAESYGVSKEKVAETTNATVRHIFFSE
ncbi:MAG: TatD family hydrolase [Prevotellaceae bacterium]|nr:TatD family hydrolase [Prevotella sp.]MDD7258140.1 TatD family hydrolase [Prevotellaceae bacterium]MDY6131126.1 TatD family hydrolase [Prevotella sp.]